MRRRSFIHAAASGLLAGTALSASSMLYAAPSAGSRFLLVFLRGGYDALSLLVPVSSSFYAESRPHIAIPLATADRAGARPLGGLWGLHPALDASLYPLFQQGQLSFIPFAGTDDSSRSHFETQDTLELGQSLGGPRHLDSGFLNRLATVLERHDAMSFTEQLPVIFRGPAEVANISLKGTPKSGLSKAMQTALTGMYQHQALAAKIAEGFEVQAEVASDRAGEMQAASRNAVSASGFELEARRMARLMRDRYAIGFVDVGGWDTHVGQGAATGYLASRFEELGRGLAGFAAEMGEAAWRHTTVVVVSEFGRTVRENGNRGTDHGHGSVYWVLGGGLATQRIAGEQQAIDAKMLFQNRDVPVLNEYRAVLGGLLQRQFGLSAAALGQVFPGARPQDLGLI